MFQHDGQKGESGRDPLVNRVARVLSPEYYPAWRAAGAPPPITTDPMGECSGRVMRSAREFQSDDGHGKGQTGQCLTGARTSLGHPCPEEAHASGTGARGARRPRLPCHSRVIAAAEVEARRGSRDGEERTHARGPRGSAGRQAALPDERGGRRGPRRPGRKRGRSHRRVTAEF